MIQNFKDDKTLQEIIQRLNQEFHPKKVYFFGSRAKNNHNSESDYDLFLIVEKSDLSSIQRMQKAARLLWDIKVKTDIFIYTVQEFELWKDELNSIAYSAFHEGQELNLG